MHMADALLSPAVGATFWAGTLGAIAYCSKKLKESVDERLIPLMGVLGAFIFACQMINFTIPGTGSSGHLGGGMILAVMLGPHAALIVMASVLTVQAFFFADGGLLALGCNIWNLGIYPCFIAYPFIYRPLTRTVSTPGRVTLASMAGAVAGLQAGAFSVVIQTLLSGRSELPFSAFAILMQPVHLGIGIVEGFVTAGVINFIRSSRPEILQSVAAARPISTATSLRNILAGFLAAAMLAGGLISWFASSRPDGLEWSIEKVSGSRTLPEQGTSATAALKGIQEKTALLPEYNFRTGGNKPGNGPAQEEGAPRPADTGTSLSGVLGALIVLGLIAGLGYLIRVARKKEDNG